MVFIRDLTIAPTEVSGVRSGLTTCDHVFKSPTAFIAETVRGLPATHDGDFSSRCRFTYSVVLSAVRARPNCIHTFGNWNPIGMNGFGHARMCLSSS
ncbi:Uncharacterised protein [Prescottella equi]|nr:Uncharacterised protein [Prescottella equi]